MSVLTAEKNLLLAVRNTLRTLLTLTDVECEVELDEMAPATVGERYFAIMPGGYRPGPMHESSGGVRDLIYSVSVAVVIRATKVPRDRKRDIFLSNLGALSEQVERVIDVVDWSYVVTGAANTLIAAEDESASEGFIEPLKFSGTDPKPRAIAAEFFGATNGTPGIGRAVHFSGARRITYTG